MSDQSVEFNRDAVITIQGGGIFGLFLIGQLEYVLQDLAIKPLAYAGTSAGAVLAMLSWAGYAPRQIRELFEKVAGAKDGIVSLLGPFGADSDTPFEFSDLGPLAARLQQMAERAPGVLTAIEPLREWRSKHWWQKLSAMLALRKQLDIESLTQAYQDGQQVLRLANSLGCFVGDALEEQLEQWLKESPLFEGYTLPSGQTRLTFRHARKASEKFPVPPLFLAATNLSTRSLELISSISDDNDEYSYDDVPISVAVRASAAVPGFFRPVNVRINNCDVSLVDGGWISNYPMWVFSRNLRARLLRIRAYQVVGSKPWIHVGLRLFPKRAIAIEPIRSLREFSGAAFELTTGGARYEMDDRAAPHDARLRPVWQREEDTSAVRDFLDLNSFDANLVKSCFADGREAAQRWLGRMSFARPEVRVIEQTLRELATFARKLFQAANPALDIHARSNIFLPVENEFHMAYRANMDDELDVDRDLSFADTKSGLSGFVFTRRRPMICNLRKIGELQRSGKLSPSELFGMDKRLGGQVRQDRTWLASVPIFDPLGIVPERWHDGMLDNRGEYCHEMSASIDGPVFGVLNLDAAIPFAETDSDVTNLNSDVRNPAHWTDVRVESIIARMEQVALHLGQLFSQSFGRNPTQGRNVE